MKARLAMIPLFFLPFAPGLALRNPLLQHPGQHPKHGGANTGQDHPSKPDCFQGTAGTQATCNCGNAPQSIKVCNDKVYTFVFRHKIFAFRPREKKCFTREVPGGFCIFIEYDLLCCSFTDRKGMERNECFEIGGPVPVIRLATGEECPTGPR